MEKTFFFLRGVGGSISRKQEQDYKDYLESCMVKGGNRAGAFIILNH